MICTNRRAAWATFTGSVRRIAWAAFTLSVVAPLETRLAAQAPGSPAAWTAFTQLFDTAAARDSIVGAGIVVVRDGSVVEHHEFGYADRHDRVRATPQTIYHYGSITKTLTAIAIMQLRRPGRLTARRSRVTHYIPELRRVHDPYSGRWTASRSGCCCRTPRAFRIRRGRTSRASRGSRSSRPRGSSWWR